MSDISLILMVKLGKNDPIHAMGKNESLPAEKYAELGLFLALEY